ncbi:peptidoglycan-associated lipoprotein Pal [Iodobacter sp. HSC-16F04]|uniref:Peptidoglycan-associated lipoprotein n=1 Tax=Iodobacter violaceini TaxID=3044271 RepID=A0ABX0KWK4_9NEIS|nr:peptidoglycan-associated lipoprotein Pal [Iodobacter violacea]NHQ87058.1 peptidoglycan-associated lipoprotein Pal [Iodobacter violacea]
MKKVALSLIMTALLAACASTPVPTTTPADNSGSTNTSTTQPSTTPATVDLTQGTTKSFTELTDPNSILSNRRVYFDFDSFIVRPDFHELVQAHAKYLNTHKDAKIILQGHTDERGTAEYNLALGQKRADSVRKMMNVLGVPDSQIETVSFGEERPLEAGDSDAIRERNRRAEIVYNGESAQ